VYDYRNVAACAAGLAVAAAFKEDNILANVEQRGEQLRSLARALQAKNPQLIKDVRGWGLINGIELADECSVTAADVTAALMNAGVLVVPAGPKVIRFVPPLIISEREVNVVMERLSVALDVLSASTASQAVVKV